MEAARFFAVAVAGLALDLVVAWSAARFLGLPLWLSAAVGFALAAAMNYALHELWTFRHGARRVSAGRALRYAMALAATLASRVATVAVLAVMFGEGKALLVLLAGAGVSFGVNFLISKFFVFRTGPDPEDLLP
jgi:putative flippase GtrA